VAAAKEGVKGSFPLLWATKMLGCLGQGSQPQKKEAGRQRLLHEMITYLCSPH